MAPGLPLPPEPAAIFNNVKEIFLNSGGGTQNLGRVGIGFKHFRTIGLAATIKHLKTTQLLLNVTLNLNIVPGEIGNKIRENLSVLLQAINHQTCAKI
nr:unnamed protein product [Callosobruchus chinensis]